MKVRTKSNKKVSMQNRIATKLPEDYPWRVVGWLTSDLREYLTESEYTEISNIIRCRDYVRYSELSEVWGLQSIAPTDNDLGGIQARYLLTALLKKFRFPTEKQARIDLAITKFRDCEAICAQYNHTGYKAFSWGKESWVPDVFTYARSFMRRLLGERLPGHKVMTLWSRHGPGASLGMCNGLNSSYHKFEKWPYTCTRRAYRYARFLIEVDQRWYGALQDDYRSRFGIPKHYPLNIEEFWANVIEIVPGNRITFVPKNAKIERSIAIEPTLNLYLQLGVDGYFRRRLKRWGIDLDSQEKNQELSRLGSLTDSDDSYVTIDLAGASDSISLKLCKMLLPEEWYSYLIDIRSPVGELMGETISYEKISSMGNGYTFALESAIFASIIYGVLKAEQGTVKHSDFAVFGDDLIIAKRHSERLIEALSIAGFTINSEKSFLSGPVRESCGTDWFRGRPVRPVFFDTTPTNVMELFTDVNRLKRLLSLRFELEESKTIHQMNKWIPQAFQRLDGPYSDECFDSYRHSNSPEMGIYNYCLWKYKRLIVKPLPLKANKFLFRKLMHDLRGSTPIPCKWDRRLSGEGSRFTVTRRNALTVGYTYSVADIWRSTYTEYYPGWSVEKHANHD